MQTRMAIGWLACIAMLAASGCAMMVRQGEAPDSGPPRVSSRMADAGRVILPGVLGLPLWPGHALAPDCATDTARSACVIIGGNDGKADSDAIRDAYVSVLKARGWQSQWPAEPGVTLLRTTTGPQRCLQISFSVWDDGRTARIRLKPALRFTLDPSHIDCANPGEGPPVFIGLPGHRG